MITPRLLQPDAPGPTSPLVYVLPVEKRGESRYGDPFQILAEAQAHHQLGAFLAFPEFDATPWFADHPHGQVRQETELLQRVLPAVESQFDWAVQPIQRLLVGFSKSGWGAVSLLMRQPGVFGYAGVWDSPFQITRLGQWDTDTVFGDQATLEKHSLAYLSRTSDRRLRSSCRFVIHGHCLFKSDTDFAHHVLEEHSIPHQFRNDRVFPHRWDMGWLWPLLVELVHLYHTVRSRNETRQFYGHAGPSLCCDL